MANKDYKVKAPDGTILTINGPEGASPEQLRSAAKRAYAARGGQTSEPTTVQEEVIDPDTSAFIDPAAYGQETSTITGMTRNESQSRAEAGEKAFSDVAIPAVRYGVPIAATTLAAITAPVTLPGAGVIAAVGAISGALSEKAAQDMEIMVGTRDKVSGNEVIAQGIANASPISGAGAPAYRMIGNSASMLAGGELSRLMSQGWENYSPIPQSWKDGLLRYGLPLAGGAATGATGKRAKNTQSAKVKRDTLTEARGGAGVTLSEVTENNLAKEIAAVERGNANALKSLNSLDANVGQTILDMGDVPNVSGVQRDLRAVSNEIQSAQTAAINARDEAQRLSIAASELEKNFAEGAPAMRLRANEAALAETQLKIKYDERVLENFGPNFKSFATTQPGVRNETITRVAKETDKVMEGHVTQMYKSMGLGPNSRVLDDADFGFALDQASRKGGLLADDTLAENVAEIYKNYSQKIGVANRFGGNSISLGNFQRFRNEVYNGMLERGMQPGSAKKLAAEVADVLNVGAEKTLATINPNSIPKWRAADAVARGRFAANDSEVIGMIQNGKADEIYDYIAKNGYETFSRDMEEYATMIAATANPLDPNAVKLGRDTADSFTRMVGDTVNETLFRRSAVTGSGFTSGAIAYNIDELITNTQKLADQGFPITEMNKKGMRALARLQSQGTRNGFTLKQMDEFFSLADEVGYPKAEAMTVFEGFYEQALITQGHARSQRALTKALKAAEDANLTSAQKNAMMVKANRNPLSRFMQESGDQMGRMTGDNVNFVQQILSLPPETAKGMIAALEKAGRHGDVEMIRRASAITILQQFNPTSQGYSSANVNKIGDFFFKQGQNNLSARNTLKAIMGPEGYENLKGGIPQVIREINETRIRLGVDPGSHAGIPARVRTSGFLGTISSAPGDILNYIRDKRYNVLYKRYVDPKYADKINTKSGRIDRVVSSNPMMTMVMRLADRDDEMSNNAVEPPPINRGENPLDMSFTDSFWSKLEKGYNQDVNSGQLGSPAKPATQLAPARRQPQPPPPKSLRIPRSPQVTANLGY